MEPCKVLKYYPCFIKAYKDPIFHKSDGWEEESRQESFTEKRV